MKLFSIILAIVLTLLATSTAVKPRMLPATNRINPIGILMAQEDGNPGHHEPPPGWHCENRANTPADHKCNCQRKCVDYPGGEDEDGNKFPPSTQVQEDVKCKVYCFKEHCRCPVHNCE